MNLTSAELREFAKLCDSEHSWSERRWDLWNKFRLPNHTFDSSLALALADALDRCEELESNLREAQEAINYATDDILDYDDAEWERWHSMPAVRKTRGGQ